MWWTGSDLNVHPQKAKEKIRKQNAMQALKRHLDLSVDTRRYLWHYDEWQNTGKRPASEWIPSVCSRHIHLRYLSIHRTPLWVEVISVIFMSAISLSRMFSSSENNNHMSIFPKAKHFQIVYHRGERGKKWIFAEEITLDLNLVCPDWVKVCQMKKRKEGGDRKRLSRCICQITRS